MAAACVLSDGLPIPIAGETWARLGSFPGLAVSTLGRVAIDGKGEIQPRPHKRGAYLRVSLPGRKHRPLVHRLVLLAFRGPPATGQQTRHINGDGTDNRLANLAWGTAAENGADKRTHGSMKGERSAQHKLTNAAVRAIRSMPDSVSNAALAAIAGVHKSIISQVRRGLRWAHVGGKFADKRPWTRAKCAGGAA